MECNFRVGEVVECIDTWVNHELQESFTTGKLYTIIGIELLGGGLATHPWYQLNTVNNQGLKDGWHEKFFKKLEGNEGRLQELLIA